MATNTATNQGAMDVAFLKSVLRTLARRARRLNFFYLLLFIPMNLGFMILIGALVAVFFTGVIPSGTFITFIFWFAVFQFSSPLFLVAGARIARFVTFCRNLSTAFEDVPKNIVWIYKAVRSGIFKNAYYVYAYSSNGRSFTLKCSEEEADIVLNSFGSFYPEVSRGWDETAAARFKSDPAELRRDPVYTGEVRKV